MCASLTKIPVIGVPIKDKKTDGISALFSVAEMPNGIPVATTAINGALNAGLIAISEHQAFFPNDKIATISINLFQHQN